MISSCDDQDGVSIKLGWGCLRTFQEVWSHGQERGFWSQTVLVSIRVSPFTSHVSLCTQASWRLHFLGGKVRMTVSTSKGRESESVCQLLGLVPNPVIL